MVGEWVLKAFLICCRFPEAFFLPFVNSSRPLTHLFNVIALFQVFFSVIVLFFIFHILCVTYLFLYFEFRDFNTNFTNSAYSAITARKTYGNLIILTQQAETACNQLVAVLLITVLPTNMLILYKLMYPPDDIGPTVSLIMYTIMNSLIFSLPCILAGMAQTAAKKPLQQFLLLPLEKSVEEREDFNCLLSVISASPAQLTGCNLFQLGPHLIVSFTAFTASMFFILIDFESSRRRFLQEEWNNCSTVCGVVGL